MQTIGLAALAAVSSIAIVATAMRKRSEKSSDGSSHQPPQYATGLPLLGPFMAFAKDPLATVRDAQKQCGDVFTIRLLTEQVTFLIGPAPHAAFFNANDEEADQAVS